MSTVELADRHADTLSQRRAELAALDEEIAALVEAETEARIDYQRLNFGERSDGPGKQVTKLRQEIEKAVGQRDRLAADVRAMEQVSDEISAQADAERAAAELHAAEEAITRAEANLADAWASFVKECEKVRAAWARVAEAGMELSALPAGEPCVSPLPADLPAAFRRALTAPGDEPFGNDPRIVSNRLSTTRTGGMGATDLTRHARDLRSTGDYR